MYIGRFSKNFTKGLIGLHCDADLTAADLLARYPVHVEYHDRLNSNHDRDTHRKTLGFFSISSRFAFRDDATSFPQRGIDAYCFS